MRALWVDAGNDANWEKAHRERFTALYYAITDPVADVRRRIAETVAHGYKPGVYMAWNWPEFANLSGVDWAERMHAMVAVVEQSGVTVKVQFDIEAHDAIQIRGCLTRWRALRPKADTSWTMEGHQGGWMQPDFVKAIVAARVRVVPQCYRADMTNTWDTLEMARDLTKRGFPDALISPFHDAARLPDWWEGFAFTQGRLP